MFKVVDVFNVGNMLSATIEGKCEEIKNGVILCDADGNSYTVLSVGMTRHHNPHDIAKSTTILVTPCTLKRGSNLFLS